jgi:rhamnosyltransferase
MSVKILKKFAVIVTYFPDINRLSRIVEILAESNLHVVIVDNTGSNLEFGFQYFSLFHNVILFRSKSNRGIAAAQNFGIKFALRQKGDVILFFDQDSIIDNAFLTSLLEPLKYDEVCVTTPSIVDLNSGFRYPVVNINAMGIVKKSYKVSKSLTKVSIAISSGMAVRSSVFSQVGLFDEDYFIDYVDTDFCLKCRASSIDIYVSPEAVMRHPISDKLTDYKFMRGFQYDGVRIYYQVRNSFLFFRKGYVPKLFAFREICSQIIHFVVIGILSRKPLLYYTTIFLGIKDGILNVKGKVLRNKLNKIYGC